jgi:hypothetical protein
MNMKIVHNTCGHELKPSNLTRGFCPNCFKTLTEKTVVCVKDEKENTSERNFYTHKFANMAEKIVEHVRGVKTSDYGETWKRLGLKGLYVKLFIKEGRLNELIWEKDAKHVENKTEGIMDTLLDMAAYAIYGMIALDEGNLHGEIPVEQHLLDMRAAIDKKLKGETEKPCKHRIVNGAGASYCGECGKTFDD